MSGIWASFAQALAANSSTLSPSSVAEEESLLSAVNDSIERGEETAEEDTDHDTRGEMTVYPLMLLAFSVLGIKTNVASIVIFMRQKFRRDFHRLLIILACYDLLVRDIRGKQCLQKKPFFMVHASLSGHDVRRGR